MFCHNRHNHLILIILFPIFQANILSQLSQSSHSYLPLFNITIKPIIPTVTIVSSSFRLSLKYSIPTVTTIPFSLFLFQCLRQMCYQQSQCLKSTKYVSQSSQPSQSSQHLKFKNICYNHLNISILQNILPNRHIRHDCLNFPNMPMSAAGNIPPAYAKGQFTGHTRITLLVQWCI